MTQPNQSELSFSNFEYLLIDLGIHSAKDRNAILNYAADLKDHIITANYTLKSEVAERERAARVETLEDIKEWAVENSFTTSYGNAIPWWPSGLYRQVNDLIAELTKAKEQ